jgi:pimeloyl-ACP methyl ester carboxylesterase
MAWPSSWSSPPGRRRSATRCWIHPSGWRPGCSTTDSYYKFSRAFVDGEPVGNLTRDHIVDDITLYWLTGTGASAARCYWESGRAQAAAGAAGQAPPPVAVPVAFTTFPGEVFPSPRSWVEQVYPNPTYFNEVDTGGHFAAWEEPELFSTEVRAAFRSLR